MYTTTLAEMLRIVRLESERRWEYIQSPDGPPDPDSEWRFVHGPFIADLCLMLLVAVWHEVEREVVRLAARSGLSGRPISYAEFQERLETERKNWQKQREALIRRLRLVDAPDWPAMELLRLIANSHKHDASWQPSKDLLTRLGLNEADNYDVMTESETVQDAIARVLGLPAAADDYCSIADAFITRAERLSEWINQTATLSKIEPSFASLDPNDFAR